MLLKNNNTKKTGGGARGAPHSVQKYTGTPDPGFWGSKYPTFNFSRKPKNAKFAPHRAPGFFKTRGFPGKSRDFRGFWGVFGGG